MHRRDTCRFLACENMHTDGDGVHTPCVLHVVSEGKTTPNSGTGAIQYASQIAVLIEDAHRGCRGKRMSCLCHMLAGPPPPAKDFWDARCCLPNRIAAVRGIALQSFHSWRAFVLWLKYYKVSSWRAFVLWLKYYKVSTAGERLCFGPSATKFPAGERLCSSTTKFPAGEAGYRP